MKSSDADSIVLDANLAVWSVLPTIAVVDTRRLLERWLRQQQTFVVPALWLAETTSAIRSALFDRQITPSQAGQALHDLTTMDVEVVPLTPALCQSAFDWAGRLRQRRAYDGFYLALADDLGCEFWTADERLYFAARQAGASRVQRIGPRR